MKPPSEAEAIRQAAKQLEELLGEPHSAFKSEAATAKGRLDLVCRAGGRVFIVEFKGSGAAGPVAAAVDQLKRYRNKGRSPVVPIVAVPFMGPSGRQRCEEAGVSWLDLSGNARILAPGIRIIIDGKPNRYKGPGRPSSVFAANASRVARWFLLHPGAAISASELAGKTGVDQGYLSRILRRLRDESYMEASSEWVVGAGMEGAEIAGSPQAPSAPEPPRPPGAYERWRCTKPSALLDAWRQDYDFFRHRVVQGHIPSRSGDALLSTLAGTLSRRRIEHAATGLAGAWLLNRFAGFRLVTFLVRKLPEPQVLESLSFREDPRGANVWLAEPSDEGFFIGAEEIDGIRCAHPIQVYLDLKNQPERSTEASERLRSETIARFVGG